MQSTRQIRKQIQSITSTSQITKAMEMVSASKMKRSQRAALTTRSYNRAALRILTNVSRSVESQKHVLLNSREIKNVCLLVVTSDKGLCGGLNNNVLRMSTKIIKKNSEKGVNTNVITVGKKAESYFKKRNDIFAAFSGIGDTVELMETLPISKLIMNSFIEERFDKITAVYTGFVSTLKQETKARNLLPLTRKSLEETFEEIEGTAIKRDADESNNNNEIEYKFEPSPEEVLSKLLPNLIETQIYDIVLESNASEHSARMIAMKNANDNAKELLHDLKLSYNYIRQQKITQEMSEISAGVTALES